jgi:hypothetical protein
LRSPSTRSPRIHHIHATAVAVVLAAAIGSCTPRPPRNIDDCCEIFGERRSWYRASKKSFERWGVPIHVQLAIMHQESRFRADARPPRRRILWVIPWRRLSSAEGYTQALKSTWKEYRRESGNGGADRDSYADAADFVGWYGARTARVAGVSKWDAFSLYLAYHEGDGGFRRGTYRKKPWLVRIARKVERRAFVYSRQLEGCEDRLKPRWWQFWL